jgi:hypothetical protein
MPVFCYPAFVTVKAMSAIVRTYTDQGFVIAADGRQMNTYTRAVISDEVQKVFPVKSSIGVFAMSFWGHDGLESPEAGATLSLTQLSMRCVKSLESRKTSNAIGYAHRLTRCMSKSIRSFCSGHPLNPVERLKPNQPNEIGDTICSLGLDGYENDGRPVSIDMRFYHAAGDLREPEVMLVNPIYVGFHRISAPCAAIVNILWMSDGDQRLSAYRGQLKYAENLTLEDAIDRSKSFISAHGDPEALAIDEDCCFVGGHIHIATITPTDGFKWKIPPQGFCDSVTFYLTQLALSALGTSVWYLAASWRLNSRSRIASIFPAKAKYQVPSTNYRFPAIPSFTTTPPFITNPTFSSARTSCNGSPVTAITSANLPASNVPTSLARPMRSAALLVAARMACAGVIPNFTM